MPLLVAIIAKQLKISDTITIPNLVTEGKHLYKYILENVQHYNLHKLKVNYEHDPFTYVLVHVFSTPQVSYKDSQDRQHTDDFDVTLIICDACEIGENALSLKYFLILTSRR